MTFLEDNIPGDKYAYVVVVFTGRNKDASTTAKVAIKLEGRSRKGKPHILVDQRKKLFERGSDDWFIMCTSKSLGELLFLHLWHDSSGTSPAWFDGEVTTRRSDLSIPTPLPGPIKWISDDRFCEKVIVQDIQTSQIWTFIVNDWLSVVHKDGKVYRGVSPATEAELNDWRNLLRDHAYITMREEHIWLRIFTRHPRSNFTRVQRVSVATCILMTCMLANIMFYGVPDGSPCE
uniref:PLAT domain-containing protein n=1 Tax=Timema poppense TaxID=170557 RepID=A0A7R9H9Z6_TIMPO|nr:unnamed protein product [Timema poppensis]